jgi:hypothetical protein
LCQKSIKSSFKKVVKIKMSALSLTGMAGKEKRLGQDVSRILFPQVRRVVICLSNLPASQSGPLQRQKRPDHVFADSLCLALGLSPDLAVDVETCVAPAEDLLHQGKADELFPEQQGEDLVNVVYGRYILTTFGHENILHIRNREFHPFKIPDWGASSSPAK